VVPQHGFSGELSAGDVVAAGDVLLAVGRAAGWDLGHPAR
jgi:hypothetical protein